MESTTSTSPKTETMSVPRRQSDTKPKPLPTVTPGAQELDQAETSSRGNDSDREPSDADPVSDDSAEKPSRPNNSNSKPVNDAVSTSKCPRLRRLCRSFSALASKLQLDPEPKLSAIEKLKQFCKVFGIE